MLRNISLKLLKPYLGMRKEIYIIFISKIINAMGILIGPFMSLLLSKKIGLSSGEIGIFLAASGLLQIPATLLGGKLADTFGRKRTIVCFQSLAAMVYISCYFIEPSMFMAFILMLAPIFLFIAGPSHDALTADLTGPEQRQGAYSLNYLGFNIGLAVSQIFAGYLFEKHFKVMFLIDAVTTLIGLSLLFIFVSETLVKTDKVNTKTDLKSSHRESAVHDSFIKVLKIRPIILYFALASIGYKFVYSQWTFMVPLHAANNFGSSGYQLYGWLGSINAIIVILFTPFLTFLFHKKTHIRKIILAGALFAIGFGMLGFISSKVAFFVSVVIFTIGEILEAISVTPYIMGHTPSSHRGRVGSLMMLVIIVGYTSGTVIMGNVLEQASFEICWMISGAVVLIATIGMKFIERYGFKYRQKKFEIDKSENDLQEIA